MSWQTIDRTAAPRDLGPGLSESVKDKIRSFFPRYPDKRAVTLPALHVAQDAIGYVSLQAMRDIVHARGGQFLVVTFPFLHAMGAEYEYQDVHARLNDLWSELDVPHLDLLNAYESHDSNQLVVNQYDAHPNERAHMIAARAIAAFVERHMLQTSQRQQR